MKTNNNKYKNKLSIIVFILVSLVLNVTFNAAQANPAKNALVQKNEISLLENYNQSGKLVAREYRLGANDQIMIEAVGLPELTKEIKIQPDGKISIPYMDNFYVAGKTIAEVQELIKKTYDEYFENIIVSVKLLQSRPYIVYMSGAVVNPGGYELNTMTNQSSNTIKPEASIDRKTPLLSNVIIAAGGLEYNADVKNIKITNDFDKTTITINLFDLINNANSSQDLYLVAGDRIEVPKLQSVSMIDSQTYKILVKSTLFQKSFPVKVMGYVNNPGLVNLTSQQSANLSSAVAAAGGYEANYPPGKIIVSRYDNDKLSSIVINPRKTEIMLMPNDIIYVPSKIRPVIGRIFDFTARIVSPAILYSNTYRSYRDLLKNN